MVKQISAAIKVEVTESDDAKHRYVLYKEWDKDKPTCTIITLFPGSAELVITDTTQMLITNQLYTMGNDDTILDCVGKSKTVIFAWGSLPHKNKLARQRVDVLLSKLDTYFDKCYYLTEGDGSKYYHPLSSNVRYEWPLQKFTN